MGCTNSRVVQPLNKNQWQVAASIGGPIIENDSRIEPIPLTSVSGAYGISQKLTGFSGIHLSTAIHGVYHLDTGISHELVAPFHLQPGITYSVALNGFMGQKESQFKLYPELDINAYWLMPYRNDFFYIGVSNWFELANTKAHNQKQDKRWIPGIHSGYTLQFDTYGFTLELKYLAPLTENQDLLIDYYSPTKRGSLAAYFSVSRKF